jgi:hypothetical protein
MFRLKPSSITRVLALLSMVMPRTPMIAPVHRCLATCIPGTTISMVSARVRLGEAASVSRSRT